MFAMLPRTHTRSGGMAGPSSRPIPRHLYRDLARLSLDPGQERLTICSTQPQC